MMNCGQNSEVPSLLQSWINLSKSPPFSKFGYLLKKIKRLTRENSMEVPHKTKNRVTISSINPTPGHVSRENHNLKRNSHPSVHKSTINKNQDMEAT